MSNENMFESIVDEVLDWIERVSDEVAPMVMGGKGPPFMRQLTGARLADWWAGLPAEEKVGRWMQLSPEEQAEVRQASAGTDGGARMLGGEEMA